MQRRDLAIVLAGAILVGSCTNHQVNFDQLPNGTALPSWTGTPLSSANPAVVTTQYAAEGVTSINSPGGGVFMLLLANTPTPPNAACPYGSGGLLNYGEPTTITLAESTCNVWVTIPPGFGTVTATVFDSAGNPLGSEASNGANATPAPNGGRRIRVNECGITRVDLSGGNYCFDDFAWQESW